MLVQLFSVVGIFVTFALIVVLAAVGGYGAVEWWRDRRSIARAQIALTGLNGSGLEEDSD
jgi:hypothetical protein